jgi:hypothetical protein
MTTTEFANLVQRALEELDVARAVTLGDIRRNDDDALIAALTSNSGGSVEIVVPASIEPAAVPREIRQELRRALRMCPLCQRIGHVEKLREPGDDPKACLVRCPECGEFIIAMPLIRSLRDAWETHDEDVLRKLPQVSRAVKTPRPDRVRVSADNIDELAKGG